MKRAQALSVQAAAGRKFGHLSGAARRAEIDKPDGPWDARANATDDDDTLPCRTCDGTGDVPDDAGGSKDCPTCDGEGTVAAEECPRCDGDGVEPETEDTDCTKCNGSGKLYESDGMPGAKREARAFGQAAQAAQVKLGRVAAAPARSEARPALKQRNPANAAATATAKAEAQKAEAQKFAALTSAAMKKVRG